MAKDPSFNFYTNDFDQKTKFFTHAQVGMYLRLLMAQHQHGHLTKEQMLFICGTYDEAVSSKFTKDQAGLYYNERLEQEIEKRARYVESRKNNRKSTKSDNISSTHEKHMSEHMEYEYDIENDNDKSKSIKLTLIDSSIVLPFKSEKFQQAWIDWEQHRKEKRIKLTPLSVKQQIKKLSKLTEEAAIEMIEHSIAGGYTGLYQPTNGKRVTGKQQITAADVEQHRAKVADYVKSRAERNAGLRKG